jgi:uncharacterized protein YbgA (DUF1722 family)/uncharacterized protein YbbK (DUF523 family)
LTVRPPSFNTPADPIRIGISTCLLGQNVRYDGGHKRDPFLVEIFGRFVEWVSVCPEVEVGLGTPRESMRLVKDVGDVRLVTTKTNVDHTAAMRRFAARRVAALRRLDLCGYVLKSNSPSCGMERVKVYGRNGGMPARSGRGLFAQALLDADPLLPVEEEGRLNDPVLRESFVERVFAYRRLRSLFGGRWTLGALVAFHAAHKLQLLAHSPAAYQALGRLVANAKHVERGALRTRYEEGFMRGLAVRATPARQVNVLQHILGYFKRDLDGASRHELLASIEDYLCGTVPLVVPLTLVRHHVRRLDVAFLKGQTYLDPHPKELMLRNHV